LLDRHPELYSPGGLEDLKQQWYPLITVIGEDNPLPNEGELIGDPEGLGETWGKYVVDLRSARGVSAATLWLLAEELEADTEAASARTTGDPPLVMVRRWSLHDPDADPWKELTIDDPTSGAGAPPSWARPGWAIPEALRDSFHAVQRQRPEEAGRIPDLTRW